MEIKQEYDRLRFNIYKLEVGVVWNKNEKHEDYDCYNNVYDKKKAYYDEIVIFELDYNKVLEYGKQYVENGVNGTYAIISKIDFDSDYYKIPMEEVMYMTQTILGSGYIEDYSGVFSSEELYGTKNIVYSIMKEKDKEHPYQLGKGNGKLIENFIEGVEI